MARNSIGLGGTSKKRKKYKSADDQWRDFLFKQIDDESNENTHHDYLYLLEKYGDQEDIDKFYNDDSAD
jgi:hypothetical protein